MKAYENAETLFSADKRTVAFTAHDLIGYKPNGTYHAIEARLFGLTYPNYLRYVREHYNATLVGKTGYTTIIFSNSSDCDRLVKELNRRWDIIIKERIKRGLQVTKEV